MIGVFPDAVIKCIVTIATQWALCHNKVCKYTKAKPRFLIYVEQILGFTLLGIQ